MTGVAESLKTLCIRVTIRKRNKMYTGNSGGKREMNHSNQYKKKKKKEKKSYQK